MKPTSPYPVLDNRPIDQWKVAELKEELKRRQLTTKGLKDDLIRRLDEALRNELESVKENTINVSHNTPESVGVLDDTPKPVEIIDGEGEKNIFEKNESVTTHVNGTENKENIGGDSGVKEESVVRVSSVETNTLVNEVLADEGVVQEREDGDTGLVKNEETIVHVTSVENNITVNEIVTDGMGIDFQDTLKDEIKIQLENLESEPLQDIGLSEIVTDGMGIDLQDSLKNDIKIQLDAEVAIPLQDDVMLESSDPSNQVSDVSTVLGFEVKTDSISSDNQKNELKDNIIADNINLELDVKPEMVNPSSSNVLSDKNEPHPMDVEDPCDTKEPVEERDEKTDLEMSKKNDSLDMGSSEKLNLDRSSGDDSMEDDTIENKPIDSKWNSKGVGKTEGFVTEDAPVVMSEDIPADMKDVDETKKVSAAPLVKRKLNDQKVVGYNEPSKRQRRWNTENLKVPEPQNNLGLSTTPKDKLLPTILKPSLSRVDSTASEGTPKERVVPPSPKSPTTSLRIDQFVRPFTLKAVQELLGKTGNVTSFWMDHIKTHCYVSYSSVEEATETRNAVYNLQWPPNGGRHLLAEFVDPQEVKTRAEAPPPPSPATTVPPRTPTAAQPPRQVAQRQQHLPPPPPLPLPPPPPLSNPPQSRERVLPPPPPMEEAEKMDTPIVTLDDLFRKTKATPRIYYLPLTDEQVAAKRRITRQ